VSRTFIHFVERGRSRPSRTVLTLIARRTRKPISYFMPQPTHDAELSTDLAADLTRLGERVRQFATMNRLTGVAREAMNLVELTLRQGAQLTKSIETTSKRGSSAHRAAETAKQERRN
jgi:transcriptional regulator with XRE-family HTH domain